MLNDLQDKFIYDFRNNKQTSSSDVFSEHFLLKLQKPFSFFLFSFLKKTALAVFFSILNLYPTRLNKCFPIEFLKVVFIFRQFKQGTQTTLQKNSILLLFLDAIASVELRMSQIKWSLVKKFISLWFETQRDVLKTKQSCDPVIM